MCSFVIDLKLAERCELYSNSDWELVSGEEAEFLIHIFGRVNTNSSGVTLPIALPHAPRTFINQMMADENIRKLRGAFESHTAYD